jgi:hypothetical protein
MKTLKFITSGLVVSAFLFSASASNITVSDESTTAKAGYYWDASWMGKIAEDNEVEPGCETGQNWDLEAFLLTGTNLTIVSGYDLKNGFDGTYAGDLFVDVGGNAGYDFVYDINWATGTYNLYDISQGGTISMITMSPENVVNASSNPVGFAPIVNQTVLATGSLNYQAGVQTAALVTVTGDVAAGALKGAPNWGSSVINDNHNIASIDVSQLNGKDATFHLTMSCGNDNMMGHASVPEPGTLPMILLGCLSLGGFLLSRKRK